MRKDGMELFASDLEEACVRLSFWRQLVATIPINIIALSRASGGTSKGGTMALLISFETAECGWFLPKKEFDLIDHSRGRGA